MKLSQNVLYIALQSEFYNIMGFLTWLGFGSGRKLTDKVQPSMLTRLAQQLKSRWFW